MSDREGTKRNVMHIVLSQRIRFMSIAENMCFDT